MSPALSKSNKRRGSVWRKASEIGKATASRLSAVVAGLASTKDEEEPLIISGPTNFQHISHVGLEANGQLDTSSLRGVLEAIPRITGTERPQNVKNIEEEAIRVNGTEGRTCSDSHDDSGSASCPLPIDAARKDMTPSEVQVAEQDNKGDEETEIERSARIRDRARSSLKPDGTLDLKDIPDEWKPILKAAGIKRREMESPEVNKAIVSILINPPAC